MLACSRQYFEIAPFVLHGVHQWLTSSYTVEVKRAGKQGMRAGRGQGIAMGFFFCVVFCTYALAFW